MKKLGTLVEELYFKNANLQNSKTWLQIFSLSYPQANKLLGNGKIIISFPVFQLLHKVKLPRLNFPDCLA